MRLPVAINRTRLPRWRMSAKFLVVASFVTILGFALVCGSILYDVRRSVEGLARQSAENLAVTIDSDLSRNIEVLDLSLRAVTNNVLSPEIEQVSREVRNLILFDHAATARHFGALQVFDAAGKLTIDASTFDPSELSVSGEEFFRVHLENDGVGLFVSRPLLYRGAYSVVLSRRINTVHGEFRGIVAGAIRFSYFHDLFGQLRLSDDDTITVLRRDGVVIMRTPFDLDFIGRNVSSAAARMLSEPAGSMSGKSVIDGIERLFVWRSSDKPLVVVVGKPWATIYAMWNRQAIWIGLVMAVLVALAALATLFLAREISRRTLAEKRLGELATTDGLTGLSNRRQFDSEIDLEWRRAVRSHESIALLMIDVDHFKSYNDEHGHQAGDKALQAVAACIAKCAKRPGDCAARYGGEEFALLLPGVRIGEALRIAEGLRGRVARCIDDPAPLTVSIGVATLSADQRSLPVALIEMADRALYEAKRSGRDRCRAAAESADVIAA